jgi:hypothetical protein
MLLMPFVSIAEEREAVHWKQLAKLNVSDIESTAKTFLQKERPELKGIETKLVSIDASYHPINGSLLNVSFIHQNSLKPFKQITTIEGAKELYGANYYMEFIFVEFSIDGNPEKIRLREVLLTNDRTESEARFKKTYDSFTR